MVTHRYRNTRLITRSTQVSSERIEVRSIVACLSAMFPSVLSLQLCVTLCRASLPPIVLKGAQPGVFIPWEDGGLGLLPVDDLSLHGRNFGLLLVLTDHQVHYSLF